MFSILTDFEVNFIFYIPFCMSHFLPNALIFYVKNSDLTETFLISFFFIGIFATVKIIYIFIIMILCFYIKKE